MTAEERRLRQAIRHVVHEYANFVSSAEMTLTGRDIDGNYFAPPINTHVSHAFYLNCRKLADFFLNIQSRERDNVLANHYVSGYRKQLNVHSRWRKRINKQLAHLTYARDGGPREIKARTQRLLYAEMKKTWSAFRWKLPKLYAAEFVRQVQKRQAPDRTGKPSEFRFYDLD